MTMISQLTTQENKSIAALAAIFSCRMLGLFMILPVIALYSTRLHGATPTLIGIALGIYGLAQACFQIPLGMLSDRFGRKLIIGLGLIIFILGSVIAACASSIHGIIIGRSLQGAGAIGSTILALISDLTTVESRTKAMAIIGITIGGSFILAMILGPLINNVAGLSGIFWLTALLGMLAFTVLVLLVPTPSILAHHWDTEPVPALFKNTLSDPNLLRLNFGIFCLHAILTASFIAVPISLVQAGLAANDQWFLFIPVLILAFCSMLPLIIIAEKKRQMKLTLLVAISLLLLTQLALALLHLALWGIIVCLWLFFTAFTFLEACLPSLVSKLAPAGSKGTAMGIYSTAQFLGIFIGGSIGGWLFGLFNAGLFFACALLAASWLIITVFMRKPPHLATLVLSLPQFTETQAREFGRLLTATPGVAEALIEPKEMLAYVKINQLETSEIALKELTDAYQAKL